MSKGFNGARYKNTYNSKNYDRVVLCLPKGSKERIKHEAGESNLSVTEYIKRLIPTNLLCERVYIGKRGNENDYSGIYGE